MALKYLRFLDIYDIDEYTIFLLSRGLFHFL